MGNKSVKVRKRTVNMSRKSKFALTFLLLHCVPCLSTHQSEKCSQDAVVPRQWCTLGGTVWPERFQGQSSRSPVTDAPHVALPQSSSALMRQLPQFLISGYRKNTIREERYKADTSGKKNISYPICIIIAKYVFFSTTRGRCCTLSAPGCGHPVSHSLTEQEVTSVGRKDLKLPDNLVRSRHRLQQPLKEGWGKITHVHVIRNCFLMHTVSGDYKASADELINEGSRLQPQRWRWGTMNRPVKNGCN